MDIRTRIKNPIFWATAIPALTAFVYSLLGLLGITPSITQDETTDALTAIITFLSALGVFINPTTKGITD